MDVESRRATPNGWTGGQFSVWRASLGAVLAVRLGALAIAGGEPLWWLGVAVCALLASGVLERWTASALALAGAAFSARALAPESGDFAFWIAALCVVALAPGAPYGSWSARDRADVAGGWTLPARLAQASWIVWGAAHLIWICAYTWGARDSGVRLQVADAAWPAAFALPVLLALAPGVRPAAWTLAFVLDATAVGESVAQGGWSVWIPILWIDLACFDPAWIRPRAASATEQLYYDGGCGLCHRAVRFVLAEDRTGAAFRFAPLEGPTFARSVPAEERARLPDSIVVRTADGRLLVRSRATLHVLERLGGFWRALALACRIAPAPLADALYDRIARVRKRLFATPGTACPLVPPELARRFDA